LRPFESHEALLFHGRQPHTEELLRRLASHRFLAVLGTSGSGKSSLVRAGLLPALHRGFLVGATSRWRIAIMRPGNSPLENLASALAEQQILSSHPADVREVIARSSLGLADAVRRTGLASGESVLVVVDQFEELFRFQRERRHADGGADAALFVASLLEAADAYPGSIYVVITMRTDYLGDCAEFAGLPEMLNEGQYLIPRLRREERREAIERPLDLFDLRMTQRLVQRLLTDLGDEPDQLPVLQHALNRTYHVWTSSGGGGPLDIVHYEEAGTLEHALNDHAEALYSGLPAAARVWAELAFRCLTMSEKGRVVRRPTRWERLLDVTGARDEASRALVRDVVLTFADSSNSLLLVSTGSELRPDSVVDISHESLIRNWTRLRDWQINEAVAVDWYRDVLEDTRRFRTGESGTWRDPKLTRAVSYLQTGLWNEAWAGQYSSADDAVPFSEAAAFLQRGLADQQAEFRRKRFVRNTFVVLGAILLVVLVGFAWSWRTQLKARHERDEIAQKLADLNVALNHADELRKQNEEKLRVVSEQLPSAGPARAEVSMQIKDLQARQQALEEDRRRYEAQIKSQTAVRQQVEQQANVNRGADAIAVLTTTADIAQFNGQWINTDRNTRGVTRVQIRTVGKELRLRAFGSCHPQDCDWGEVNARPYGTTVTADFSTSTRAVVAQFDTGAIRTLLIARPAGPDRLVIETFTDFGASGRTAYQSAYVMERLAASKN